MSFHAKCTQRLGMFSLWEIYYNKTKKWKYYDFANAINCMHKLTSVCTCACMCDHMHFRKQCATAMLVPYFLNCLKVSLVFPLLKYVGEKSTVKNYCPVSFLSVVSKVFEKLVNNILADLLQKCSFFSNFQYGFRFSQSTASFLTVVSDRNARAFNRSGATQL